jgi:hypothetical protein
VLEAAVTATRHSASSRRGNDTCAQRPARQRRKQRGAARATRMLACDSTLVSRQPGTANASALASRWRSFGWKSSGKAASSHAPSSAEAA